MAVGDAAVAAGMAVVVATTAKVIDGATEINRTRDYVAERTSAVTPVTKGGTGATTASGARTNLGAAAASHSHTTSQITRTVGGTAEDGINAAYAKGVEALNTANTKVTHGADATLGHIYTPNGRNTPVTTNWVAAALNSDGRLGIQPSAARFKQDVTDHHYSTTDLMKLRTVAYRLITAVEFLGDAAPWEFGVIAEDLLAAGFPEFVVVDDEGQAQSVHYQLLVLVVIGAAQELAVDLQAVRDDLEAIRAQVAALAGGAAA